jgi:iron(III) transport system permease protein
VVGISYILAFNVPPFELTGTAAILVICFVFRNMPVGVRAGIATLSQIDKSLDEASHTLGARSATTLRRVVMPAAAAGDHRRAGLQLRARHDRGQRRDLPRHRRNTTWPPPTSSGRVEAGEFGMRIAYSCVLIAIMLAVIGLIQFGVGERKLGPARYVGATGGSLMVEFKSVSKRYGGVTAVDDISFRIDDGTLTYAARALRAAARPPPCA